MRLLMGLLAWRTIRDTGVHAYQENRLTGARRVVRRSAGYQPFDRAWERGPQSREEPMTDEERAVIDALADAWDAFSRLPVEHGDDTDEFRRGIHVLQRQVFARPARREFSQ